MEDRWLEAAELAGKLALRDHVERSDRAPEGPGDDAVAGVVRVLVRPARPRAHIQVSAQIAATLGGLMPGRTARLGGLELRARSSRRSRRCGRRANTFATRAPIAAIAVGQHLVAAGGDGAGEDAELPGAVPRFQRPVRARSTSCRRSAPWARPRPAGSARIRPRFLPICGSLVTTHGSSAVRPPLATHEFGSFAPMSMVISAVRPRCARRNLAASASWLPAGYRQMPPWIMVYVVSPEQPSLTSRRCGRCVRSIAASWSG